MRLEKRGHRRFPSQGGAFGGTLLIAWSVEVRYAKLLYGYNAPKIEILEIGNFYGSYNRRGAPGLHDCVRSSYNAV